MKLTLISILVLLFSGNFCLADDEWNSAIDLDQEITIQPLENDSLSKNTEIKKVDTDILQLLGKGVENRHTGEVIGFACNNSNCSEIRMVYFTSDHLSAYLFGNPISLNSDAEAPTKKQIKTTLRKLSNEYKNFKKESHPGRIDAYVILGGTVGIPIISLSIILTTSAGWPLFLSLGVFTVGAKWILSNQSIFSYSSEIKALHDQNGWNWSIHPKKVSRKSFDLLIEMKKISNVYPEEKYNLKSFRQ